MTTGQPDDLNLLREWREPVSTRRIMTAGAGVILYHVLTITVLVIAVNAPVPPRVPDFRIDLRRSVPLYVPRELTQQDPNRGKITHDLDVRSAAPPAPVPQAPRFRAPEPVPQPVQVPAPIEAPKLDATLVPPPPVASPGALPVAPPPTEQPKLAFEDVGAGGKSALPNSTSNVKLPQAAATIEDALRNVRPPSGPQTSTSGGIVIGDLDDFTNLPSPNLEPSSGPVRSNLQLLSDPAGIDFKPYLVRVLTAVRANWLSVIPESARLGRRGRVLVQFIIDRRGGVPKLVIAESSGTAAFDRAAVAGISASYPFPALPANFKGSEIRLQLAFSYNQPTR